MPERETSFLVTCEHASNQVPTGFEALFRGERELLRSHRGWDSGAREIAARLARGLDAGLVCGRTTRLLVDLNRSPGNPAVFSKITRRISKRERRDLLERFHAPHWERIQRRIADLDGNRVIHVAVHTFTSVLNGRPRTVDVGLLYDPSRVIELQMSRDWQRRLAAEFPDLRVRRNAPYRGNADGLPTALRRRFAPRRYVGFELEIRQGLDPGAMRILAPALARTLRSASRSPA